MVVVVAIATAGIAGGVVIVAHILVLAFMTLDGGTFMMASHCDRSPSWHSTSNSIVSRNILFSSLSHSRFSENRRYIKKKIKKK